MKSCRTCKVEKPRTPEFFNRRSTASVDGMDNQCRDCHRIRMKKVNRTYYAVNREAQLIRTYSAADKAAGRDCDLTPAWLKEHVTDKPCFYCDTIDAPRGADRIDNDKGHTKSNVVPCCKLCNKTRNDHFTVEEMQQLGAVIKSIRAARLK